MRIWHLLRSRIRSLVFRRRRESDLAEELQAHLDREAERLQADGLAPDRARIEARRLFGGVQQIKEECRDARGTMALDALGRDARHGLRRLMRDWRFSTAAVLMLGLGIGANTAVFSLVNAVLFRPNGVSNPDRLVDIYQTGVNPNGLDANSYPAYRDIAEYTQIFSGTMATFVPTRITYEDEGTLRAAVVEHTTASYLSVLGRQPSMGRWFTAAEDVPNAPVVAVLGYRAWERTFRADPSIIGRRIRVEGIPVTIVGVGPRGLDGNFSMGIVTDFWLPISALPALFDAPHVLDRRPEEAGFFVKARLRDGVTVAQAQAAMDGLGRRLATEYPKEDPGKGIRVFPSKDVRLHPQADVVIRTIAAIVLGVVALVLAVACSNLATLLLVRGTARAKEIAIRLAIGASRRQLVRQLLAESVLLSLAGGAAGCLFAWWGIQWLQTVQPITVDVHLDMRVLAFASGISLLTGIAFGLAPALRATRVDLVPVLREAGAAEPRARGRLTLKNALIVFQVAVSVLLLGGASLVLQMLSASRAQRVGFAVDGVAMIETDARYAGEPPARQRILYDELLGRIAGLPGVQAAALTRGLPMHPDGERLLIDGRSSTEPVGAGMIWASPGYFETLRIPILFGRPFDARDRPDTLRVAIVSETMARQYFGTVNAVGRRFRPDSDVNGWMQVVGVVADTGTADRQGDLIDPTPQLFYRCMSQDDGLPTTVVARTSGDASALAGAMQRELRALDGTLPVVAAKTMAQDLEDSLVVSTTVAVVLAGLGAAGLVLASIGLYAVIAFAVERRSREIGIRMALGARSAQVVWTLARGVAGLIAVGTIFGAAISVLLTFALRSAYAPAPGLAFYRPRVDPIALLTIAAIMVLVGIAAAFVPARRASSIDPLLALRHD
jgi:putative ABC transport system permease protein